MPKTRIFQVTDGRIHFKCPFCQSRRMITIPPGIRKRSVRCQKCSEFTSCVFNRRKVERNHQTGRVLVMTSENNAEVSLFDVSLNGVGFELDLRNGLNLSVGRDIQFRCNWNSRLISQGRWIVRSVQGRRVGAERRMDYRPNT
jgi:hypothetical protein